MNEVVSVDVAARSQFDAEPDRVKPDVVDAHDGTSQAIVILAARSGHDGFPRNNLNVGSTATVGLPQSAGDRSQVTVGVGKFFRKKKSALMLVR